MLEARAYPPSICVTDAGSNCLVLRRISYELLEDERGMVYTLEISSRRFFNQSA
jgi:hypothetical protein